MDKKVGKMFYNYHQSEEYQYDSCTAKGVCSVTPIVSSLNEVIVMYLKNISYYTLKLHEMGVSNEHVRDNIIQILSTLVSGADFLIDEYERILYVLYEILNQSKILYSNLRKEKNLSEDVLKSHLKEVKTFDFNKVIKQGEREFLKKSKNLKPRIKNWFEILFCVMKSVCINLIDLKSYNVDDDEAYIMILKLLNLMNETKITEDEIKLEIENCAAINFKLVNLLKDVYSSEYGKPEQTLVSFSTRPHKAILVSGANLKELELLLEAVKNEDVDVYTHGAMMLAHTYPSFKKYKNLRGQFGIGIEHSPLDFAKFPGSILMTKHSLPNVENLYRGRLFTTDYAVSKGVVQIENNDFSPVIKSALKAKGFSKGMEKESLYVGISEKEVFSQIDELTSEMIINKIKNLALIIHMIRNHSQKKYFEKIIDIKSDMTSVIVLSCEEMDAPGIVQIETCHNSNLMYSILDRISNKFKLEDLNLIVFITKCDMHMISNILNLKQMGIKNIYMPSCPSKLINPAIIDSFKEFFEINTMTTSEYDSAQIHKKLK